jgi:hypothetical protein
MKKTAQRFSQHKLRHMAFFGSLLVVPGFWIFPGSALTSAVLTFAAFSSFFLSAAILATDWFSASHRSRDDMESVLDSAASLVNSSRLQSTSSAAIEEACSRFLASSGAFLERYSAKIEFLADRHICEFGEIAVDLMRRGLTDIHQARNGSDAALLSLTHIASAFDGAGEALSWPKLMEEKMRLRIRDRFLAVANPRVDNVAAATSRLEAVASLLESIAPNLDDGLAAAIRRIASAARRARNAVVEKPIILKEMWEFLDNDIPKIERILPIYARLSESADLTTEQKAQIDKIRSDLLTLPHTVEMRMSKIDDNAIASASLASESLRANAANR